VAQVHATGVANGLGINSGDELVAVGDVDVTTANWAELVQRLSTRPVVARFCRKPTAQQSEAGQDSGGLLSSVGSSLLTVARNAVPVKAANAPVAVEPNDSRLQCELERLSTLLKARDREVAELLGKLGQREEALRILEAGDAAAGGALVDAARFAQERLALSQQVEQLQARADEAEGAADALREQFARAKEQCAEEARQKEEQRSQATALAEQCDTLMKQFESLRATCQNLSLDAQGKAELEGQVQELMRMNAQWQHAHHALSSESEGLRQRAENLQQLQAEVEQLRRVEATCVALQSRLHEAEGQIEAAREEAEHLNNARQSDYETIHRLQALLDSMHETGESEAGQLETELLERSRECAALRRQSEEHRRRVDELLQWQSDMREIAEEGRALKSEVTTLKQDLATCCEEKRALSGVVDRCVEKLERDSRERPHLVDKRMVTQMVAAYLEQRENPRQAQEIIAKMADLLGFTSAEREQVGLSQQRRTLAQLLEEPASLADLSDRFMDFLLEEAEG